MVVPPFDVILGLVWTICGLLGCISRAAQARLMQAGGRFFGLV